MTSRRMILCLGPHRSGTSTVAAALQALGADLRLGEVYANAENAKGFFEQPEILEFDERLLAALGGAWDAPAFDCRAALAACPEAGALADEAVALLGRVFAGCDLAAMKDPRQCILLPFWLPVLARSGFDRIDMVHVLRDPVEVAKSQQTRALAAPDYYDIGRELAEGAALWLSHSVGMWDAFDRGAHVLVAYDRLVDAPAEVLDGLAKALDLTPDPVALAAFQAAFIDPGLRRSRVTVEDRAQVAAALPQALAAFDALRDLAGGLVGNEAALAGVRALWPAPDALARIMAPVPARLSRHQRALGQDLARTADHLTEARAAVAALQAEAVRISGEFTAQMAGQVADFETERQRTAEDVAAERADLTAEIARLSDEFTAQLAAQAADFEVERQRSAADVAAVLDRLAAEREAERAALAAEIAQAAAEAARLQALHALEMRAQEAGHLAEQARVTAAFQAQIAVLQQELAGRAETIEQKAREIAAVYASASWKVAAPVRVLGRLARRGKVALGRPWFSLNHAAKRGYRQVARVSPDTAEGVRKVLAPVLRMGNRALLDRDYVPPVTQAYGPDVVLNQLAYQRPRPEVAYQPLVTVLVPNYNHAPYLRQRLDSVYAQTYPNFEVILMDDCSSDDSRAILQDYADRYPDKTRVIFNEVNSGGAFFQWERGIKAAKGSLIWVAESDDWCSLNFLDALVPFFANEAVQLAYGTTNFMNKDGSEQVWSLTEYLSSLGSTRWTAPFVLPAPVIVREAFAEKNIIPNVSSAVFRRMERLEALENAVWRGMRTCGDWVFYLNLIRGGLLAFTPEAQNYYRLHQANTSVGSYSQDRYYEEHQEVAKTVQRHYRVDPEVFTRQRQDLMLQWARFRERLDRAAFDRCYDLDAILAEGARRRPNLLMAGYGFCVGGGETFPLALANLMKAEGYNVTYLDCGQEPELPGIRGQLASDIPVVGNFEDLNGIVRDFDIGVVHSHHAWVDNTVLDVLPEDSPARTVITLHGMYETIPDAQLKSILPRLVQRTAEMVYIAEKNTEALTSRRLLRLDDLTRIDNALPRGGVQAVPRSDLGIAEDAFVLTVVSRGIPEKGWDEAVQAVARARKIGGGDLHLVIVGDGPEYDRMAQKVPEFVHMVGFRANTRDYFAMADLGFLPSRFKGESFPLVLIDCLNAGRPVLASDLGEIRSMLTTDDGLAGEVFGLADWAVPVETLARRIAELAAERAAVAAMAARVAAAAARFDPALMAARYDLVYQAAVAKA